MFALRRTMSLSGTLHFAATCTATIVLGRRSPDQQDRRLVAALHFDMQQQAAAEGGLRPHAEQGANRAVRKRKRRVDALFRYLISVAAYRVHGSREIPADRQISYTRNSKQGSQSANSTLTACTELVLIDKYFRAASHLTETARTRMRKCRSTSGRISSKCINGRIHTAVHYMQYVPHICPGRADLLNNFLFRR